MSYNSLKYQMMKVSMHDFMHEMYLENNINDYNRVMGWNNYSYITNLYCDYLDKKSYKNMRFYADSLGEAKNVLLQKTCKDTTNLILQFLVNERKPEGEHETKDMLLNCIGKKYCLEYRLKQIFDAWEEDKVKDKVKKLIIYKIIATLLNYLTGNFEYSDNVKNFIITHKKKLASILMYDIDTTKLNFEENIHYISYCCKLLNYKEQLPIEDDPFVKKCLDYKVFENYPSKSERFIKLKNNSF